MSYSSIYEKFGIHFKMSGDVTAADLSLLEDELYRHREFDSLKYIIIDYTDAESFTMDEVEVKIAAARDKAASLSNPNLKILVISSDDKIIDALLQYNSYSGSHPWESSLHVTLAEARKWIKSNITSE